MSATATKPYASGTVVAATRSQEDIEKTLARYGAKQFGVVKDEHTFAIAFIIPPIGPESADNVPIQVRFVVYLPSAEAIAMKKAGARGTVRRTEAEIGEALTRETNRLWRSLALGIKAKLVLVDDGIETIDQALYAHVVNPSTNRTVYEETRGQVVEAYRQIGPRRGTLLLETPSLPMRAVATAIGRAIE